MKNLKFNTVSKGYTVSTSELEEFFETMVFDTEDEVEQFRTSDKKEALKNHARLVKKYTVSPEIVSLSSLLKKANEEGKKFIDIEDGGTCNFDSVVLNLKGKRSTFIQQLEKESGFSLTKISSSYWSGGYFINFTVSGQAGRRTKMAETACKFLKENSVDVSMYYAMD